MMNTHTNTNTIETAPIRRRDFRKRIAAALAGAAIITGTIAGVAAPAQAATGEGAIGACFNQVLDGIRGPMPFRTVYLDVYLNGGWRQMPQATYYTDRAGCIPTTPVPAGYSFRFRVSLYERPYTLSGVSKWATVWAGSFYNLGPVDVLLTR